ncbi:dihydrolipoyl dehydrogenase [Sinanaerobacter chloroacetimidivorans]|uniref:Dihydrolipoyl dehydrogenase n=1 Tax=Sinanaerobacter chloroacetimidivorans TaxID=2818044 RepID=A0A8J7W1P4_9FIRM|nr:dihydrolipoyl dehydrogenase [Sinanaerobacter chloroacetimidivorans]MBR0599222.1 dihydrolipoyl dehydrogenase [Sinanaerobacter chloroacetimidivorans]
MADIIIMPKLGFNMSEGKLVTWHKKEGDAIKKGEPLFSIETDKTTIDIEATGDGILRKILLEEGEKIPVTLPIAIVAGTDENIDAELADALAKLGKEAEPAKSEVTTAAAPASAPAKPVSAVSSNDFDIIVIGGGPGGYVAAIKAAQLGKRTAIIEEDSFGGVCLNRGCIPTKVLLRSAEALKEVKESEKFGVTGVPAESARLDMKLVQRRKSGVVSQLVGGVNGLLKANGVSIFQGTGEILDHHTIKVGDHIITTEYLIIATGSVVKHLPVPADPEMNLITSNEALNLTEIPENIVIIGGGVIGIEFAYFLASIGSKVTVVEFLDRILPMVDEEITDQVSAMLKAMGVTIHTGAKVTAITKHAVEFEKAGNPESVETSSVLMAVGRIPNLSGIDCQGLNIKTERGAIVTDLTLKTSVDNIYAIGDVNGKAMLAHTASMEAVIAVENICGHAGKMSYDTIPSAIYLQPEIACVGLTEAQAKAKYGKVKVGKFPLLANGKAKVAGEERGLIKVIVEPQFHEVVGVHLYCIHATDMIAEAVLAMNLESTAEEVAKTIHPHPTVSEVYHEAFHAALDQAIHFI